MKMVRTAPPKPQPSQAIRRFEPPALGPHHQPPPATRPKASNDVAADAVRIASTPGKIDPRQMRF